MRWVVIATFSLLIPALADAAVIRFETVDLPDTNIGEDLWEYRYHVSDFIFDDGFGFSILFDSTLYAALDPVPAAPNGDWDVITLQPDSSLPDDGLYDALSVANSASLADIFVISFVWLGPGTPSVQPFVVYEPGFATIESGVTVPEPSTASLLALGTLTLLSLTVNRRAR
jgi:hypothetical protein